LSRALLPLILLCANVALADIEPTIGSYGRVGFTVDTDGGQALQRQITLFGPRLTQGNYLELDLGAAGWETNAATVRVLTTISIGDRFAHASGDFATGVAVRQAFVEASDLWQTGAFTWLGSRMARGDDVYLLDFWPMDDLNILGVAGGWRSENTESQVILGFNRAIDGYQLQYIAVPDVAFGDTSVTGLNRQRTITAASTERRFGGAIDQLKVKAKLYAELHYLPSGRRTLDGGFEAGEPLPDDRGWLVGAQLGLWNFKRNGHLNLWVRYANGLAAFDELQQPMGLDKNRRADGADELRVAVSGNVESTHMGVMFGGYYRFFKDADPNEVDYDDGHEMAAAIRPFLFFGQFTPALEASIQLRRPNGLNPRTNRQEIARVVQLAALPAISLGERPGTYSRPQLRLIVAADFMNQAALDQFPERDVRAGVATAYFFGARAEWWFGRGGGY
jgi:maltoporin